MSCHACQEAAGTELRACGHRLCGGCLTLLGDDCINELCKKISAPRVRLNIKDWEKIETVYQDDMTRTEVGIIHAIEAEIAAHKAKIAYLREKYEQDIVSIGHHIKTVTANMMQEESLAELPEGYFPSHRDLPTPKLILASENLVNGYEIPQNKFKNGSVVECSIIGVDDEPFAYNFGLRRQNEYFKIDLIRWPTPGHFHEDIDSEDELDNQGDAFDLGELELCGFRDKPESFLFRETISSHGDNQFIINRDFKGSHKGPVQEYESVESFTTVGSPVKIGHRLYRITVGQTKEFLILFDLPHEPLGGIVVRKCPRILMVTFDKKHTILLAL
jgi:hypothetical protein